MLDKAFGWLSVGLNRRALDTDSWPTIKEFGISGAESRKKVACSSRLRDVPATSAFAGGLVACLLPRFLRSHLIAALWVFLTVSSIKSHEESNMLTRPTLPDPSQILERLSIIGCRMGFPANLREELSSDLVTQWWDRGWEDVPFPPRGKLDGWLRRCLNNVLIAKLRRDAARRRVEKEFVHRGGIRQCRKPEDDLEADELGSLSLRIVMQEAGLRGWRVMSLFLQGWSTREIAVEIAVSRSTVRQELRRARKLLQRRLKKRGF